MKGIADTGLIVAFGSCTDQHHAWAREVWAQLEPPVHTCEAVLSEAQFLIKRFGGNPLLVWELLDRGTIEIDFALGLEVTRVRELQRSYRELPMSLADACLVRMSELHSQSRVFTTDSDFHIFRRNRRQLIPVIIP